MGSDPRAAPADDDSRPDPARDAAGPRTPSRVGDAIDAGNARWSFGPDVVATFEAHIERSVPGYRAGHDLVARVADFFVRDGSLVYELGCSTGALSRRLVEHAPGRELRVVGVEREPAMAAEARRRCAAHPGIEIVEADLLEVAFEPCDLMMSYYTAQFVRPAVRQSLFDRVHEALEWGGAFVLFEKVRAPDARFQDLVSTLYADYKLERGFGADEILAKTRSLKGVLEPFSTQGNLDLLARAGFVDVTTIWKHLCFEGFLAIK